MATSQEYTVVDLRQMDREEARNTLTVNEFERWEKLRELDERAAETKRKWENQAEQVADLTVRADPDALGTELDLMGNPVLVRVSPEDEELQAIGKSLERQYGDIEEIDPEALEAGAADDIADHLIQMLDCVLLRWDGHDWSDLDRPTKDSVLAQVRSKWGIDGLMLAWVEIAQAVEEDMDGRMEVVDRFRGEGRRGHR